MLWWVVDMRRRTSRLDGSKYPHVSKGLQSVCCVSLFFFLTMLLPVRAGGQETNEDSPPTPRSEFYLSSGLGFLNIDTQAGIAIPVGLTAVLTPYRLLFTASAIDIGLLEEESDDPRFERLYVTGGGRACLDRETGFLVSDFRCSGGTDVRGASSADLSLFLIRNLWFGNQPGNLFAGGGFRAFNPKTPYATFGLLFNARPEKVGGFKVNVGNDYVSVGIFGGLNLRRWF